MAFPRTTVGGVSVSRLIVGTNWFLGYSHCTQAKDTLITTQVRHRRQMADILEVFFRAGVDTVMGLIEQEPLLDAIKDAEDRTGVGAIIISTPGIPAHARVPAHGFDPGVAEAIFDRQAVRGTTFCFPHQSITDALIDRCTREVRHGATLCRLIRERGMIPGLSSHMPEAIVYADESGLDVATYITLFNSLGFLMQLEVDWVAKLIHHALKPVMTIKPMAAGQLRPFQAFTFVWNAIRPQDMVAVGTMTPDEAREVIDLSLAILEGSAVPRALQQTRSKASVLPTDSLPG